MIVYEQDWLVDQFLNMEATQNNVSTAFNWMTNMDFAATKAGVTIQLCMPLPNHVLQTVMMNSVTQIRASGDYQRQIYNNNNWAIGYTSLLHHSLGVFPFKDCFWSSNQTQTGCVAKVCHEPNAVLETLSALLSTGAVGPADKIGYLDKVNLMQTCRTDGVLLKPDVPAMTMDLAFSMGFTSTQTLYNISRTYSRHPVVGDNAQTHVSWHYILAADTLIDFTVKPTDVGESDVGKFMVFDYFEMPTNLRLFDQANPLNIKGLQPNGQLVSFKYYVIVPIFTGYSLIGERDKFSVASSARFGAVTKISATNQTTVKILGAPLEVVHLEMYYQPTQKVEAYTCKIGSDGLALLTCMDDKQQQCTC